MQPVPPIVRPGPDVSGDLARMNAQMAELARRNAEQLAAEQVSGYC